MAKGFKHGAGGANLNFKVIGGTATPANPKENTIWVNTSTAVTSWVFSVTEPEVPVSGMVWFFTGITSGASFNALKKNDIQVYPVSAKQYVSGAWVEKPAKIYQGGAWVKLLPDLFLLSKDGTHDGVTGGWYIPPGHELTKQSDGTYLFRRNTPNYSQAYTNNKIDVSEYKTLIIKKVSSAGTLSLWLEGEVARGDSTYAGAEEINIDISAVSGKYKVYMATNGNGNYGYIESIRLVKW